MITTSDIKINKIAKSRVTDYDVNDVPFGKCFSDHMFVAEYFDGKWQTSTISPYGDVPQSYAMSSLHYGQAIFEGMKAYKNDKGEVSLFRPLENFKRLNKSAIRMCMPEVPEEIFMGGLLELLKLDSAWVPTSDSGSLYIRPFLIATDEAIGVKPSESYKFIIITCPAGKYYSEPIKVIVETDYFRAVHGGVGFVKAAGNYGRSLYPTKLAQQKGYQQVIWTDSATHHFVEESGTMNLMFVLGDTLLTPALSDTILAGITRDSVLALARDSGMKVEERKVSLLEVAEAYKNGQLNEAFGCGTAATIAQIVGIGFEGKDFVLPPVADRKFSTKVDETLRLIRKGKVEDKFNWMLKV
ncbi:MAG: branched-chain amino acid aminotransferase [Bacteroidota bacterium]|nr:branched-chain amino acid aminotransferase [Bacteroidota bacterium]MDP3145138.1 branched-chain amino acid aminotransferase [Bacteroidota bacterium]MDP3556173.1 branched-chain amino acid aminotransferase [Bacteroidota bacterium]